MTEKKGNWSAIKEMVFTYLAINKVLYWMNFIANMEQGAVGGVWQAVIARLLFQDAPLILGVVAFYFLDRAITMKRSKYSKIMENILFYAVGFVILMGIYTVYLWILSLFTTMTFTPEAFGVESWAAVIVYAFVMYLVASAVLNVKQYFKDRGKADYALPANTTDDKLTMLEVLFADGVLNQEEFEEKKAVVIANECEVGQEL